MPQGWIQTPRSNTTPNTNPGPPVSWNDPSNPDDPQAGYGYIPTGSGGRWSSSGIEIECKGNQHKISTTHESDSLYQIYGDSVINHIVVRYLLKEPFPHVYYVDSMRITYK